MGIDKSLISGSTATLILRLLEEKDMYGYEMIETLRRRSKDVFELKAAPLVLHILTAQSSARDMILRSYNIYMVPSFEDDSRF